MRLCKRLGLLKCPKTILMINKIQLNFILLPRKFPKSTSEGGELSVQGAQDVAMFVLLQVFPVR